MKNNLSPLKFLGFFYLYSVLGAGVIAILTIFIFLSTVCSNTAETVTKGMIYFLGFYVSPLTTFMTLYFIVFIIVNLVCLFLFIYRKISKDKNDIE